LKPGEGVLYSVRVYVPWKDGDAEIDIEGRPDFLFRFEERAEDSKKIGWVIWFSEKVNLNARIKFSDGNEVEIRKLV